MLRCSFWQGWSQYNVDATRSPLTSNPYLQPAHTLDAGAPQLAQSPDVVAMPSDCSFLWSI